MLTEEQLRQIVPAMKADKVRAYLPHLNAAMEMFAIDTPLRTAAFIAQLAHESGSFVWMKELWGPTAHQQRYEPPGSKAADLGNTQPGDGRRYMGRGPIQLTGRANYERFGRLLGLDLVGNPDQVATPEVGFQVAGLYWKSRNINAPADADDIVEVTRRVNGGRVGLADRTAFYERAKQVLAEGFVAAPVTRGMRSAPARAFGEPLEPLNLGRDPDAPPVWAAVEPVTAKKPPAKKAVAKKAVAKKAVAKNVVARKPPAKKAPARKAVAKKAPAKKAPTRKASAKTTPTRKAAAKKAPVKKVPVKKAVAKKAAPRKSAPRRTG